MTATLHQPVPIIGWDANRPAWLAARRTGLGASDVLALLGFSAYRTPWQVWAEKSEVYLPDDEPSEAAEIGTELEPWLRGRLADILGHPVKRTPAQLYSHPEHSWRLASPDGIVPALGEGVECKTAGIAGGFGPPSDWSDDRIPLGYEFQVRWQMHVCGWSAVHVVALLANVGVRHYRIERDVALELELVGQVSDWWERHVIGNTEPPMAPADSDVMPKVYRRPDGKPVDLDGTDVQQHIAAYRAAHERETAAKAEKQRAGAELKRLLGEHTEGLVEHRTVVTWNEKRGSVEWARLLADVAAEHGSAPNPDDYRKPATRALSVKDTA